MGLSISLYNDNTKLRKTYFTYTVKKLEQHMLVRTCYRSDLIESIEDDKSINIRAAISNKEDQKLIRDWKRGVCVLKLDNKEKIFKHEKIQLDQNGTGNCTLESNKNNF